MKKFMLVASLLASLTAQASTYEEALDKSRDAFMIQSGLNTYIDRAKLYAEKEAKTYVYQLGVEKEVVLLGGAYKIYREQEVVLRYHRNRLHLRPTGASWEWSYSW